MGKIVDKGGQAVRVSGAYGMCLIIVRIRLRDNERTNTSREARKGELRGQ